MRKAYITVLLAFSLATPTSAHAAWEQLRRYLKPTVQIVSIAEDRIVLRSERLGRDVVITAQLTPESDFYYVLEQRRGGNPYRVWLATPRLIRDPLVPRTTWGSLFVTAFLRIVRRPEPEDA